MIRLVLAGIWICAVTSASAWVASAPGTAQSSPAGGHEASGVEHVTTRQLTVPRIAEGAVQGYVLARFAFTADAARMKAMAVPAEIFVADEAFRVIYADESVDFASLRRADLTAMAARIAEGVNARLAAPLVHEVLLDQFDYVTRDSLEREAAVPPRHAPGGASAAAPASH